jgi:hypothetical protein
MPSASALLPPAELARRARRWLRLRHWILPPFPARCFLRSFTVNSPKCRKRKRRCGPCANHEPPDLEPPPGKKRRRAPPAARKSHERREAMRLGAPEKKNATVARVGLIGSASQVLQDQSPERLRAPVPVKRSRPAQLLAFLTVPKLLAGGSLPPPIAMNVIVEARNEVIVRVYMQPTQCRPLRGIPGNQLIKSWYM